MNNTNIPGSKWWKFDFHAHTPESDDYSDKAVTPTEWLLAFMRNKFDAVVVTDHNSGEWVDPLKAAAKELMEQQHPEFRELAIFPGAEMAASGGIHILLVLDPTKGTSDVARLIGACAYTGERGDPSGRSTMSLEHILEAAHEQKAIVIPAHVDGKNGLWGAPDYGSQLHALNNRELFAIERLSKSSTPPSAATAVKKAFAEVVGSDSHGMAEVGRAFTWVKMGQPTLEGLRLALLDGNLSLRRGEESPGDPNESQATQMIEQFEVSKGKFVGMVQPFVVAFNPWMNALIGGRGTGKSSLLEFMRITLRREGELDKFLELASEFKSKYAAEWAGRAVGGLQTADTQFRLIYRKDGQRYRISFARNGSLPPIEESSETNEWKPATGDIHDRFPVRIYSQKEIYAFADSPAALLGVIDQDAAVGKTEWEAAWGREQSGYRNLMAKIRELWTALSNESRLRGELADVNRKLQVLEKSGNQAILQAYQRTRNQARYLELWAKDGEGLPQRIIEFAEQVGLPDFDPGQFDPAQDGDVLAAAGKMAEGVKALGKKLEALAAEANIVINSWKTFQTDSPWSQRVAKAQQDYEALVHQLQTQGVQDPSEFGARIRQRQTLEQQLKDLDSKKQELTALGKQRVDILKRLIALRQSLSNRRAEFLRGVLKGATHVQIRVVPFGDHESAVREYRRAIRRETGLDQDILDFDAPTGILASLYDGPGNPAPDFLVRLEEVKGRTTALCGGSKDGVEELGGWFVKHLEKGVRPEDLDELDLWFPDDSLEVMYRPREGEGLRPISQGSPGQKTAALLAFLLSYGTEPILLDQPEDDLDNQLIFNLVTQQLIENKTRRQVIVVTHNANIVVNGDAELVLALESRGGQTAYQAQGGLQDDKVRQTICEVMEGGEKAFELRYRRIKEGLTHV
jgi:energy-coupling factor transporter ATP-binding protein EcfA2